MYSNWLLSYEMAKAVQDEILNQVNGINQYRKAVGTARTQAFERRRFFRRYQLRSILYRLAPRLAARFIA